MSVVYRVSWTPAYSEGPWPVKGTEKRKPMEQRFIDPDRAQRFACAIRLEASGLKLESVTTKAIPVRR